MMPGCLIWQSISTRATPSTPNESMAFGRSGYCGSRRVDGPANVSALGQRENSVDLAAHLRAGCLRRPTRRRREVGHHHPTTGSLSIVRALTQTATNSDGDLENSEADMRQTTISGHHN